MTKGVGVCGVSGAVARCGGSPFPRGGLGRKGSGAPVTRSASNRTSARVWSTGEAGAAGASAARQSSAEARRKARDEDQRGRGERKGRIGATSLSVGAKNLQCSCRTQPPLRSRQTSVRHPTAFDVFRWHQRNKDWRAFFSVTQLVSVKTPQPTCSAARGPRGAYARFSHVGELSLQTPVSSEAHEPMRRDVRERRI